MFPQRLDSPLAYDIAKAMLDGFNRHYRLFRTETGCSKHRFETADWHSQQSAQRERILHRSYFQNDFVFVRPAVSTEYIESDEPAALPGYRAYYPSLDNMPHGLQPLMSDFDLRRPFEDQERDCGYLGHDASTRKSEFQRLKFFVQAALETRLGEVKLRANFQLQVSMATPGGA